MTFVVVVVVVVVLFFCYSSMAEVMRLSRFLCHSVCLQHYSKSNQLISSKLVIIIYDWAY